mgnify:CR=1 FL=1
MSGIYLGKKEYWNHMDNAARDIAAPVKRAGEVGDGRLKALYALQAGMNAREIQKNQKTDKAINKNNTVGISASAAPERSGGNREIGVIQAFDRSANLDGTIGLE